MRWPNGTTCLRGSWVTEQHHTPQVARAINTEGRRRDHKNQPQLAPEGREERQHSGSTVGGNKGCQNARPSRRLLDRNRLVASRSRFPNSRHSNQEDIRYGPDLVSEGEIRALLTLTISTVARRFSTPPARCANIECITRQDQYTANLSRGKPSPPSTAPKAKQNQSTTSPSFNKAPAGPQKSQNQGPTDAAAEDSVVSSNSPHSCLQHPPW